jgi:hypothetical protein
MGMMALLPLLESIDTLIW